jgi:hypothetical protein
VPDNRYPLMINGVAVVSAPVEIDIVNVEQLRAVLLEAGRRGHGTVVVDMTRGHAYTCGNEPESGGEPRSGDQAAYRRRPRTD